MTSVHLSGPDSIKLGGYRRHFSRFLFVFVCVVAFLMQTAPAFAQTVYEADAAGNAIEGAAQVESCAGCLDGKRVGNIGNGSANYLRIKNIGVPTTGTYVVALYYTEGSDGGARSFTIQINNGAGPTLSNLTGSSWTAPAGPVVFEASFTAGNGNSVGFFNATGLAPNVDHITVSASPLETSNAPTTLLPTVYEGNANANTFGGSAVVESCTGCLDGTRVGMLGNGSVNSLTINGISVPSTGVYSVTLYYVEGADGGTRSFDVIFGNGSDLSLANLTGSSWAAPASPVTFLANFMAGSNNFLRFSNADGPAPDVDHIVVSGTGSGDSGSSSGGGSGGIGSGNGGNAFTAPEDIAQYLVNDYVPQGVCAFFVVGSPACSYYYYDQKARADSATYGGFVGVGGAYDPKLPINNVQPDSWCWTILIPCHFQPTYFQYLPDSPEPMILSSVGVSGLPSSSSSGNGGLTFLLRQYTVPHTDQNGNNITGDVLTALGTDGGPVFSIREIGNRWGLHSYQKTPASSASEKGFDELFWEPYTYQGNAPLFEDIYFTFSSDGRLTIDKFTPYWDPPGSGAGTTKFIWEESDADAGWPFAWNSDGSRNFTEIEKLVVGGVNGNPNNIDGFRELKVFNTALTSAQMTELENDFQSTTTLLSDMAACNTGQWMNNATVQTPCGLGGHIPPGPGPEVFRSPVPLPKTGIVTSGAGLNPATESYAPVSFSASDSNFNFTFSFSPPSQNPPLSEIQDPTQPAPWAPFYPLTPVDYTLYLLTQDDNGLHQCQADLSQVGTNSNPGGGVLGAALGADYLVASLNGPNSVATTAWVNPNPQNFIGTITVPAGWQCTGGQFNNSGNASIGGLISGNGSGTVSNSPPPGSLSGTAAPGRNFDLSVWELQLPIGSTGNPTTISNAELEEGFQDEYFFTNSSDGALGMKDPGVDCVTTSNSSHCRTELREVNTDGTAASWSPTGVNKLDAILAVEAAGGGVVIGQLHFDDSVSIKPLAQLYYDDSGNISVGVEQSTAGGNEVMTQLGNVPLGISFSYEFNYSSNQLSISINNAAPVSLGINSSLVGLPVYFKAGDYGQATEASDVHFFALKLTHQNGAGGGGGNPTIKNGGWYNIVNVNSGLCLDDYQWSTDLGASLDQWQCGDGQANQQWQLTSVGNGIYQVSNGHVAMSWNVTGGVGATANSTPIQLWSYSGDSNEEWTAVLLSTDSNGNGVYKFVAQNSGLCLDVPSASMSGGQQLDQYSCNGSNAQAFTLLPVAPAPGSPVTPTGAAPPPPPSPDPNAWYQIVNVNSGSCLDVSNFGTALGTSLDQWTCGNGQANQQWQFVPTANGFYQVNSRFVAMSWNITGGTGTTTDGSPIQLWSYGGASNEQWKPVYISTDSNGHNVFKFIAESDGLCLDVPGASTLNGQQLDQYSCNGTNAQVFTLIQVTPASSNPVAPTAPAPPPPPSPNPNLWYRVVSVNSDACVDVFNWGTALGTALDEWTCGNRQANQEWQFTPVGDGVYKVSSRFVAMSWNVTGGTGATGDSVPIQLWSYTGNSNEQWQAVYLSTDSNGNNIFEFIAQNSGLCLGVPNSSTSNGQQLDQYTCNGTNSQAFTLVAVDPAPGSPVPPTTAAPPPAPSPDPNAWYNVVNVNSNACLDVSNWGTELGTNLDQWTCGNGQANQQWQFRPLGNAIYEVSSRFVGMSWNVTGGEAATGIQVPIQLWSYSGDSNEQWLAVYLSTDSNGIPLFKFLAQNSGLCLDVPGASKSNGQQLDQYTCNGTDAQAFRLMQVTPASGNPVKPTSPPPPLPNPSAWYQVVNISSNSCLDVSNWGTSLGTSLDQWSCQNGQANQQWQFTPVGTGVYQVHSRFVSMSWNVKGGEGATDNSTPIQLWSYGGDSNEQWQAQYWYTDGSGNQVYQFTAENSGLCLDVPGASKSNGQQLDQYTCNGTEAQAFRLVQVTPASANPVAPTPPPAPTPDQGAWYQVVNVNSNSCLDVSDWNTTLGAKLDQWACGHGQANQQWQFISVGNGVYRVNSRFVAMSWNITGGTGATGNSTPIQLWSYAGNSNEQWQAVYLYTDGNGNSVYRFIAQNSGRCLDVPGASKANGEQLDQYSCNGTSAQEFTLVQVNPASGNPVAPTNPAPPPPPTPDGNAWYNVVNVNSNACLDVYDWGTVLGNVLDQWTCGNGQANQQWQFVPLGNGVYRVNSRYVAMSWNVQGGVGATANSTRMQLWSYGGGASNEQFRATYLYTDGNGNNVYNFIAQNSGRCLDVPGASKANGQQLDQYSCNGTNAQAFTLVKVNPAQGNYPVAPHPISITIPLPAPQPIHIPPPPPLPPYLPNYTGFASNPYQVRAIMNVNSGLCVDVWGGQNTPGATIDQYVCGIGPSQQWQFFSGDDNVDFYYVRDGYTTFLEVKGGPGATADWTQIGTAAITSQTNQQWKAVLINDGPYKGAFNLIVMSSGKCLDVPWSSTTVGQALDEYDCNGTGAQAFWIYDAPQR